MTLIDGVELFNKSIPKDLDAVVVLLVGLQSQLMSVEEMEKLDSLRGDKLNLVHEDAWHPEMITKEDAELIRRGLDVYRSVLWQLNKEELEEKLKAIVEKMGKVVEDEQ